MCAALSHREQTLLQRVFRRLRWVRQRGLPWVLRRLLGELRAPTTRPGRVVRDSLAAVEGMASRSIAALRGGRVRRMGDAEQTLYFFYDLEICPIAYDIATHLAGAE